MYCIGRFRSPHPYVLGRPVPCITIRSASVVIKPPMANSLDKLCWSSEDTILSPSSPSPPPSVHHLTGKLLLQSMQNSLEKEQLHQQLVSVASQLGVGASGDCGDIMKNISCLVTESEERRQVAEKRAKVIEDKYLDSNMKIQVLELELAEARRQRDTALENLQDLTWQPSICTPAFYQTPCISCCFEGNPHTPETASIDNRVAPNSPSTPETAPYHPSTPNTAPYVPPTPGTVPFPSTTPDTAPIDSLPVPPSPSPRVSGLGEAVNGTPPTVPISAQVSVDATHLNSRSPSVSGTIGGGSTRTSSRAAALASSYLWGGMTDLKSFHHGGGDIILGSGANGTVHLYRHRVTDMPIAVKTIDLPEDFQAMTRKVNDIQAEANCLNIFGRDERFPAFLGCLEINSSTIGLAMEFIGDTTTGESFTLSRGIREIDLSQHDFMRLSRDIAKALGHLHEMGYLMNDLKEDNCLLRKTQTGQWQAIIIDFGSVCPRASPFSFSFSDEDKEKYRNGAVYVHIAPECALDDHNTSISSDVFQLGRLLTMMGVASNNADLTAIGNLCRQNSFINRPSVDEVVDELERVM